MGVIKKIVISVGLVLTLNNNVFAMDMSDSCDKLADIIRNTNAAVQLYLSKIKSDPNSVWDVSNRIMYGDVIHDLHDSFRKIQPEEFCSNNHPKERSVIYAYNLLDEVLEQTSYLLVNGVDSKEELK